MKLPRGGHRRPAVSRFGAGASRLDRPGCARALGDGTTNGVTTAAVIPEGRCADREQSSIPVDQDPYAASVPVVSSGRSTSLPFSNVAPARTSATRCGALTARQRDCAASISL